MTPDPRLTHVRASVTGQPPVWVACCGLVAPASSISLRLYQQQQAGTIQPFNAAITVCAACAAVVGEA